MEKYLAKEIVTKEGHIYSLKRPLHKQGWFWVSIISWLISLFLLILLIGFFILSTVLSNNVDNIHNLLEGNTLYLKEASDYEEYDIGKRATLDNGGNMTVTSIRLDHHRTLQDDATGIAVVVQVKVDNKTNKSLTVNPYYFSLYNEKGDVFVLDMSTFDQDGWTQKIAAGTSAELTLIFDGEASQNGQFNVVYNGSIRWWQERKPIFSSGV